MKASIVMPLASKKSFSLMYWPFSAAPPIHWLSPIIRSHSLPPEFSSFSMRSAKLVHGTNSKCILLPDCASYSLLSSISALAGSQAAQHSVRSSACAAPTPAAMARDADVNNSFAFIAISSRLQATASSPRLLAAQSLFEVRTSRQADFEVRTSNRLQAAEISVKRREGSAGVTDAADNQRSGESGRRQPCNG